jgi:hypothetical protein
MQKLSFLIVASFISTSASAMAAQPFNATKIECDRYFIDKRAPVFRYDIAPTELENYYGDGPNAEYFKDAADKALSYCMSQPDAPRRSGEFSHKIKLIWFASKANNFNARYNLEDGSLFVQLNQIAPAHAEVERLRRNQEAWEQAEKARKDKAELDLQAQKQASIENDRKKRELDDLNRTLLAQRNSDKEDKDKALAVVRDAFQKRHGITAFIDVQNAVNNVYAWKGETVAVNVKFTQMINESTAVFGFTDPITVHGVNPKDFIKGESLYTLLIEVRGKSAPIDTSGSILGDLVKRMGTMREGLDANFKGAYECKLLSCADVYNQ